MKYNVLRSVAATLSLGVCTLASAQYGAPTGYGTPYGQPNAQLGTPGDYRSIPQTQSVRTYNGPYGQAPSYQAPTYQPPSYQAPAKWSTFGVSNPGPALFQPTAADAGGFNAETIPTPPPAGASFGSENAIQSPSHQPSYAPTPAPQYSAPQHSAPAPHHSVPQAYPAPQVHYESPAIQQYSPPVQHVHNSSGPDGSCSSCNQGVSPFVAAAQQPWDGGYSVSSGPACGVPMAAPVRAPLFPWFGQFDLLFFNMETNGKDRNVVSAFSNVDPTRPYLPAIGSSALDPDSGLGYNIGFGRYLGCGQFGLGVNYFNFNPDDEVVDRSFAPQNSIPNGGGGGAIRSSGMPQYHHATMIYMFDNGQAGNATGDSGAGYQEITGANSPYTVYDIIDGRAGQTASNGGDADADQDGNNTNNGAGPNFPGSNSHAEAVRVSAQRDVDFQGLEVNLFSFGLMGAQRASAIQCGGGGCGGGGFGSALGLGAGFGGIGGYGGGHSYGGYGNCNSGQCGPSACDPCGPRFGFGGAGGPLVRPCNGKVQVLTSHGIRWFQFEDTVNYAYDIDGRDGFGNNDLYDDTRVENNLFGYQFGSQLVYCLGSRLNLFLGGKFGVYGNDVEQHHRLGSRLNAAELAAMPGLDIDFTNSDTVLATLGEVDLGLGYRVTNAWTVRGGYRVMGVSGVASADGYSRDYSSSANAMAIHADESLLLHGAYVGAMFNW